MKKLKVGQVLCVVGDHGPALKNIPRYFGSYSKKSCGMRAKAAGDAAHEQQATQSPSASVARRRWAVTRSTGAVRATSPGRPSPAGSPDKRKTARDLEGPGPEYSEPAGAGPLTDSSSRRAGVL